MSSIDRNNSCGKTNITECIANAVFLRSRAGKEEELAGRLEELVLASRSDSGVMIYDLHRSTADPASWFIYERYESQEHFNRHLVGFFFHLAQLSRRYL